MHSTPKQSSIDNRRKIQKTTSKQPTNIEDGNKHTQPTLYQQLAKLSPQEMVELKLIITVKKYQRAIILNVGEERLKYYQNEVNVGRMTWEQALEHSAQELSPFLRELNNLFYARDKDGNFTTNPEDLLNWYDRNKLKSGFGEAESKQFNFLYSEIKNRTNETERVGK